MMVAMPQHACHCTPKHDPAAVGFAEYHEIAGDHPSDGEIVGRMKWHLDFDEQFGALIIRGHRVGKADQQAAWDRYHAQPAAKE